MNTMSERYIKVLERLYMTNMFNKKKVDLGSIKRSCELFNNPQEKVNYIHVTGTNGKGSVCKKLAATFYKSGMKTGIFMSPHISSFRERIQINDKMIEKEYIVEELQKIYNVSDKNNLNLTYFEFVTMLCFNYYRDMRIDVGVIEVGLGGNLDSTNVIDPLLSVITSIGMDHMDILGCRQREIAEKKAGIIKPCRPSLIGLDCNPREVFIRRARDVNSKLFTCDEEEVGMNMNLNTDIDIGTHGVRDFDSENNRIVIRSVQILKLTYPDLFSHVTREHVLYGIKQKQPCRKEDVTESIGVDKLSNILNISCLTDSVRKIYLDVAHNSHAMEKLLSSLREEFPKDNLIIICGFSFSKDKNEIFKLISSYSDRVYFVSSDHPRLTKYEDLLAELKDWLSNFNYDKSLFSDFDTSEKGDIQKTIHKAVKDCRKEQTDVKNVIVICGSFFIMKDARRSLGYQDEEDPVELNEINQVKFNM